MKVGRNDPCPCGSGKKYKQCCLPREQVISLQAIRAERNHQALMDRLIELAVEIPEEEGMAEGVLRYYGGRLPIEPEGSEHFAPIDWVLFGYRSPETGLTVAEHLTREARRLSEAEREQIREWVRGAVPGFFHVTDPGPGQVHLRRMWDPTPEYVVTDQRVGLHTGDLIGAWLLPTGSGYRFGYLQALLPPETNRPLEHLVREEMTLLRRQRPDATLDDLYRDFWPRLTDAASFASTIGDACLSLRVQPGPQIQGGPRTDPSHIAVARRLAEVLEEAGAPAEEAAGGLRLWWDAVHALKPRINRVEPWVGAVIYLLSNRIYDSGGTQAQIASMAGTSAASVGSRSREIDDALAVETWDPRYADLLDPEVRAAHRGQLLLAAEGSSPGGLNPALREAILKAQHAPWPDFPYPDTPEGRAEELIDQAWQATGKRRLKLAQQAIDLWPDAADAYVILGHGALERKDLREAARLYQAGVEAGERALGKEFFAENAGHFWGLVESRPYMRARASLADALWSLGEHEQAIGHYQELLRLNPGDNQGIRWVLAARLVELGDDRRLEQLLKAYHDEASATMGFTAALLAFRQKGPGKEANALLKKACRWNPHVPAFLLGRRPLPRRPPEYVGIGDEDEAKAYAMDFIKGWQETPGALQWLASRT